jgi:hypothetical protein
MPDPRTHDITALLFEWRAGNQFARNLPLPDLSRLGAARHEG